MGPANLLFFWSACPHDFFALTQRLSWVCEWKWEAFVSGGGKHCRLAVRRWAGANHRAKQHVLYARAMQRARLAG